MKLIQPFEALIHAGVTLTLRFSAAGATNIQLDILPQGKDTKTGVSLPPKAIVGTAQELDENLEAFIAKYAPSVQRVAEVVAGADADLQKIESDASAQAKKAVDEKAKTRAAAKPGAGKSSTPAPKKDLTKGMLGGESEEGSNEDNDDGDPDGGAAGDVAATTLLTTGHGAAPATAAKPAAAPAAGLDASLF